MTILRRNGLVIDEKILLAAASLPGDGFTAEELVVAVFQRFPRDFSLMGFPQFPDSNKILTQITTSGRGLQRRGWLTQVGTKRYKLTGEAHRHLEGLGATAEAERTSPYDRDIVDLAIHWLESYALQQSRLGRRDQINERQALAYWKLTSGATAARTHRMLALAETTATFLEDAAEQGREVALRHDLRLSPQEGQKLADLHRFLSRQFNEALSFLRNQRR